MKRLPILRVIVVLGMLLFVAACGDDDDASQSEQGNSNSEASTAELVDISESEALIEQLLKAPTTVGVTEPLTEPPATDGSVVWLECPVPECVAFGDGVEAASKELGWKFARVAFDFTPESAQAAFEQALRTSPDAIMGVAADPSWLEEQRQAALDQGVAFFDCCAVYEPDARAATGGFGEVSAPPTGLLEGPDHVRFQGQQMADYAIVETGGEVKALSVYIPDSPIGVVMAAGFSERLQDVCPDTCSVSPVEIAATDIGANAASQIVSALQRDPSINYVTFISGSFATGVDAAIAEAGFQDRVRLVGNNPIPANLENMVNGEIEQAWTAFSSRVVGWRYVDMAIRHMQGHEIPAKATGPEDTGPAAWAPTQFLTKDNYPDPVAYDEPSDHPDIFRKLWLLDG